MKKFLLSLLIIVMCLSVVACGNNEGTQDLPNDENNTTDNVIKLEPNLQRLQGNWAASVNYEDDDPSFLCPMPATWDENMKGYYVITITNDLLTYQDFHKSGHNGRPGGNYDGYVYQKVYEIEKITEKESDEYKTVLLVEATLDGTKKEIEFVLYDNPEIYKNSFMTNGLADFMFVKINSNQYSGLMDIVGKIHSDNAESKAFDPYIGMTKSQLENSTWGEPEDINTLVLEGGNTHEQWCYSNNRYVYVDNGYVTAIQK